MAKLIDRLQGFDPSKPRVGGSPRTKIGLADLKNAVRRGQINVNLPVWQRPIRPQQLHQVARQMSPVEKSEVGSLLSDPSLTVEDKVMLALMLLMKKMDKDIEKQNGFLDELINNRPR